MSGGGDPIDANNDDANVKLEVFPVAVQKISPEGKSKIQLQVVLHDGTSSTFHFVNKDGQEAQVKDRDDVKELLQQLLPKFKRKVNKELEEKNRWVGGKVEMDAFTPAEGGVLVEYLGRGAGEAH